MKIYIVTGSVGEYSDRKEFTILATKNKKIAEEKVLEFTKLSHEHISKLRNIEHEFCYDVIEKEKEKIKKENPLIYSEDEYIYTGDERTFFINECELID